MVRVDANKNQKKGTKGSGEEEAEKKQTQARATYYGRSGQAERAQDLHPRRGIRLQGSAATARCSEDRPTIVSGLQPDGSDVR